MMQQLRLSETEKRLEHCATSGEPLDLRTGVPEDDDIARASGWPQDRSIRAEVLVSCLLRVQDGPQVSAPIFRLSGARITGRLVLTGANIAKTFFLNQCYLEEVPEISDARTRSIHISKSYLPGLDARRVNVDGRLDLTNSLVAGRLRLVNAHVTGELIMNGSKFVKPGEWTLFAGGIIVDGGFFGRRGFESQGGIRLVGARLNGGLFLDHAKLVGTEYGALVADNMIVEGRMVCDGLVADGDVRMPGSRINGQLSWDGAAIHASEFGLDCRRLVAEELILTLAEPIVGPVDLGGARVSVFCDDPSTWPTDLRLDGFVYSSLIARSRRSGPDRPADRYIADSSNASAEILPARERLRWLRRTATGYRPQPYEQLAQFYRSVGHDDEARKVLLAKQRYRRSTQAPVGKLWGYILDWSVGYGYRPWLAALWLIALVTAGTIVFSWKPPLALSPRTASEFDPFVYTINLLLPVGQFVQPGQWNPVGAERWFAYALVGAGWLLATAVIAGITRVLNRS
jgi:hypothetical protein